MELTQVRIGPFLLKHELGRGGMSVVYLATDTRLNKGVALKVLPPQFATDSVLLKRFIKEGRSAASLRHKNIVRIYESGKADGYHFIAMEPIRGGTLQDYLARRGQLLSINEALSVLSQIAEGLDYAHRLGFLHRDIKLSNILFTEDGRALISDFGVAKHMFHDNMAITLIGQSIGTPNYMSPEQAKGILSVDYRSDVYSLGVIAYTLFTGRLPFRAGSQPELLHKIVFEDPIPPNIVNPEIPFGIVKALRRVLDKDPKRRYASAGEFVAAIQAGNQRRPNVIGTIISKIGSSKPTSNSNFHPFKKSLHMSISAFGYLTVVFFLTILFSSGSLFNNVFTTMLQENIPQGIEQTASFASSFISMLPEITDPFLLSVENPDRQYQFKVPTLWIKHVWLTIDSPDRGYSIQEKEPPLALGIPKLLPIDTNLVELQRVPLPLSSSPQLLTDFENFGEWRRGQEPYGLFIQSQEQVHSGESAGQLIYNFPEHSSKKSQVVFAQQFPISQSSDTLGVWVYGDGSGNFLHAWVTDANSHTWQFTFGQINHTGWALMKASLDVEQTWPNGPLLDTDALDMTSRQLHALVLDGYPQDRMQAGQIYIDNLFSIEANQS